MNGVLVRVVMCLLALAAAAPASGATLRVCASGCAFSGLQAAIDAATPGDTILLRAGETFVGPFVLRAKPASTSWIEIRSDAPDASLPADGVRLVPSGKPGANTDRTLLARLIGRGDTYRTTPVVRTEPGAHHYRLRFLEIDGIANEGWETLIALGDDTTAAQPHDLVLDRVYAHGHFRKGQKRGIALNSGAAEVLNSYISDIRAVGFDSQAIAGYNGTGPFKIVNNYLEAAGENIMFGGADPAVYNLVPTGIEIRRNHIVKPLDWRGAILSTPSSVRASDSGTGGALAAGTHYFKVVAYLQTGPVLAQSLPSTEAAVTLPGSRTATITWATVPGAERYRVYRGWSPGGQSAYMDTSSDATTFQYTGVGERSGSPPTFASEWVVKNLLELKNAQQVTVHSNVIENIWAAGQNGYAIVITPRNQSGGAPWVRVQDVTFANNIIRNAAGVLTLLGYDDLATSQQTRRIAFRNNLIYGIDPAGGWAKTFVMGGGPASVVIDHNTIIHRNTAVVFPYGTTISGFAFTNNVTLHNEYGIMGDGGRPGTYSIDMYFPDGIVRNNVLAGCVASAYPAPIACPTLAEWDASFVDASSHDYRILTSSVFYGAGEAGTVPGADLGQLDDATRPSYAPLVGEPGGGSEPPETNTAPVARPGGPYQAAIGAPFSADGSASSDAEGAIASYLWRWHDDIVIHASDVAAGDIVGAGWVKAPIGDAAGGFALHNPDRGAAKIGTALASPSSYVDVRFYAAAGVPYRIWFRARAQNDAWTNDSLFVQFSGRVDAEGRAAARIGTTEAAALVLEEGNGAGVAGWGWNDEAYGSLAGPVYFATSGPQTLRIQQREDGMMWDQIVISSAVYGTTRPGAPKNDTTLVSRTLGTSGAVSPAHTYHLGGQYPVVLTVSDAAGLSHSALTSVAVGGGASALTADAGGPYAGGVGQSISLDGSGSSASTQYRWTFGDDIVLDASALRPTGSRWQVVQDASAATGRSLENADRGEAKITTALASPASYVEATFKAAAGVPYRVWIRMRAANDAWTNDSVLVQFSGAVTSGGAAVHRIGSSGAMGVVLEEGSGAGVAGWGWADGGYGTLGAPIYFNSDGEQRIRIQQREDGVRIDQVVISAGAFADSAPGALKNDATIVPPFPPAASGVVVSHAYRFAGLFPVTLTVSDGSQVSTAATTVTVR